nr:ROK family protein [Spirilliplanes yamanashiensis]
MRRHNLGALLRHVHVHGATSRAELTHSLGLNRSTIGALAADLAAAGLVSEQSPGETTGEVRRAGRPSLIVRPLPARVYAYALAVDADRLRAARVGLGGVLLDARTTERPPGMALLDAVGPLAGLVRELTPGVPAGARCVGGGVAVAHAAAGVAAPDDAVEAALADALPGARPLATGATADLAALAEHVRGAATGCANIVYLHGDTAGAGGGIGGGIIAGGRRVTGHGGHGGEAGHMVVHPRGLPCACGSRGCWQTEIGAAALLRGTGAPSAGAVLEAAARGDEAAAAAVRRVADWLGFGVANLVNIVNPEAVVFGGTLLDVYAAAPDRVRAKLDAMALPVCREHVRLRPAVLGDDAPLLGAAELAFERLLADPLGEPVAGVA